MMKYIKMEKDDIERIIENHQHYINKDCENWESMRANLSYVDLSGMDLKNTNLRRAILYKANLYKADLRYTDLCDTNLKNANLEEADLRYANLEDADLKHANLMFSNLYGANLKYAYLMFSNLHDANLEYTNLIYSDLYNANLENTNLKYANLSRSNLYCTDLGNANLEGVNLYGATIHNQSSIKGEMLTQDIIGYKKCKGNIIVTLKIPRGAIVFSINGSKCRTNKVIVLDIEDMDGNKVNRAQSLCNTYMSYYIGDEITDYTFNCQYNVECSNGIHFFRTKKEAKDYKMWIYKLLR